MIKPHLNIFAIFIFLGAVQGIYMAIFFFFRKQGSLLSHRLFSMTLITVSLIILDIFLGYSGYLIYALHLNNTTEPLNFLIGPLFYLYILSVVHQQKRLSKIQYLHFIPALFFLFYMIPYFLQSPQQKYNDLISAFYPGLPKVPVTYTMHPDPWGLRNWINEATIVHISLYVFLSLKLLSKTFRERHLPFFSPDNKTLAWLRRILLGLAAALLLILSVKIIFNADLGDYIIATYVSIMIYSISFQVIKDSRFFDSQQISKNKKYEKSALTADMQQTILSRLEVVIQEEKPYLDSSISLSSLAKRLSVSTHYLSQIFNEALHKSFYEYIAHHRIQTACNILKEKSNVNLIIEEIAETVGYNSKSAFNNAFKKHTGMTPSEYRQKYL